MKVFRELQASRFLAGRPSLFAAAANISIASPLPMNALRAEPMIFQFDEETYLRQRR